MASLCGRLAVNAVRRNVSNTIFRAYASNKVTLGDPLEHATGLEKRELLAKAAGNPNPFDLRVIKQGPGTRERPTEIPSAFDARIVGCICEEEAAYVNWMWLYKGQPKRCECGHWYTLVHKAPV
ncbi:cytochrome c oxidase subunit 5B, mitochondrial-like [Harmonia axyridis]|uniref:cytochrome c oxidase subunit 5B, mitochondrial-like n=1 Tax=Harmonia axyridis TaxID=115357 RepID=UPI001E277192|nr:cytochrome c oxidase subunit 5B, mitochondrial-like [Harmonia axyridis]